MSQSIHRRKWLKLGLGLAAGTASTSFGLLPKNNPDECTTPRQEYGPYPPMKTRTQPDHDVDLTVVNGRGETAKGAIILVSGKVLDESCTPIEGAIVEIWQANHFGKYNHEYDPDGTDDPNFQGWGQAKTDANGNYRFKTILPGLYGHRTRHIHYKVAKRGYHELVTQLYFDGEERNKTDGLVNMLTHDEQQKVIQKFDRSGTLPTIAFNINLEKVVEGQLPEKVLTEYDGRYQLAVTDKEFKQFLDSLGGPYDKIVLTVTHTPSQLYFSLPFTPESELLWKERDRFDASSFYSSEIFFNRDAQGKVVSLQCRSSSENFSITGTRV